MHSRNFFGGVKVIWRNPDLTGFSLMLASLSFTGGWGIAGARGNKAKIGNYLFHSASPTVWFPPRLTRTKSLSGNEQLVARKLLICTSVIGNWQKGLKILHLGCKAYLSCWLPLKGPKANIIPFGSWITRLKKHQLRKIYTAYYTPFETVTMVVAAVEGTLVPNRSAH